MKNLNPNLIAGLSIVAVTAALVVPMRSTNIPKGLLFLSGVGFIVAGIKFGQKNG